MLIYDNNNIKKILNKGLSRELLSIFECVFIAHFYIRKWQQNILTFCAYKTNRIILTFGGIHIELKAPTFNNSNLLMKECRCVSLAKMELKKKQIKFHSKKK